MRWLVPVAVVVVAVACSKGGERYGEEDFASFSYRFSGTGNRGSFSMNRDCGIAAEGVLYYDDRLHTGTAVAGGADCREFKRYAVSEAAMAAYSPAQCGKATDDEVYTGVTLTNGEVHALIHGDGCSDDPDLAALRKRTIALRDKYIPLTPPDTGVDGG